MRRLAVSLALLAATTGVTVGCDDSPRTLYDRLLFSREDVDTTISLWTMTRSGRDLHRFFLHRTLSFVAARIAPDGKLVAVVGFPAAGGQPALYLLAAKGGNLRRLPNTTGAGPGSWAPDGSAIAFACRDSLPPSGQNSAAICVINRDGTGFRRVNHSRHASYFPAWSPDGLRLAFVSDSPGPGLDLYSMDLAGADLHRITQTAADEWAPAWSPDGAFLAFSRPVDPLPSQIHVVRPDGTDERTITSLLGAATGPVWSPTGTEIVFGGPAQLYVVRPDSTGLARLTHGPPASWPSWGPPDPES